MSPGSSSELPTGLPGRCSDGHRRTYVPRRVAVVVPVLDQFAFTRNCVLQLEAERQREHERATEIQIIVVDNGSSEPTASWLAQRSATSNFTLVRNAANRGCAAAWNQGCREAMAADWTIILNNDVYLPQGWLGRLLDAADWHGLDVVSPAMRERALNYDAEEHSRVFAARLWMALRPGATHGVCFAVRRNVFARIGGFDENFRVGQFEDTDFFRRAREAQIATGTVGASFIHHFGSITQIAIRRRGAVGSYEEQNRAYFRLKWKLGWWRRRFERWLGSIQRLRWQWNERRQAAYCLHEIWRGERWVAR